MTWGQEERELSSRQSFLQDPWTVVDPYSVLWQSPKRWQILGGMIAWCPRDAGPYYSDSNSHHRLSWMATKMSDMADHLNWEKEALRSNQSVSREAMLMLWHWKAQQHFVVSVVTATVMSDSLQPHDGLSTPGSPVLHYLLEFPQTHVHWVSDAI